MNPKVDPGKLSTDQCLGMILSSVQSIEVQNSRTVWALIGVIAAQIGVKVLGTDPLLDIATTLAILGSFLLLGCLVAGLRLHHKRKVTRTGLWLIFVVVCIMSVQIAVYFRDLGFLNPRIIYCIRIVQNLVIVLFAWNLMRNARIFNTPNDKPPC